MQLQEVLHKHLIQLFKTALVFIALRARLEYSCRHLLKKNLYLLFPLSARTDGATGKLKLRRQPGPLI